MKTTLPSDDTENLREERKKVNFFSLRPYQNDARGAILTGFQQFNRQLAVLPTGAGKTIIFASICADFQPERALVLAHRDELLTQAADKIRMVTGLRVEIEAGTRVASPEAQVVVSSVQSMARLSRQAKYGRDHFGIVIVDEAHHALADSYQSVIGHFASARLLGVTATPDRGDKRALAEMFDNIAYEISIRELIKAGFLAPIRVQTLPVDIDLAGVRKTAGDLNAADTGHALEPYLERIAEIIATDYGERKILSFLPLCDLSQRFADHCANFGIRAAHVAGDSPDRAEKLRRFAKGDITLLSNAQLLTEGYDEPSVDCVLCLRPTTLRSQYAQIVGRGTRLHPGKDHLLLLDPLWLAHRHALAKPASLIAEDELQAASITEILREGGDLMDAENQAAQMRAEALRKRLAATKYRKGALFDPLALAVQLGIPSIVEFEPTMGWHDDKPSEKQAAFLERAGVDPGAVSGKGQAAKIITEIMARRDRGLASPKQVRLLRQYNHPAPETATFTGASDFINQIAQNGWRRIA